MQAGRMELCDNVIWSHSKAAPRDRASPQGRSDMREQALATATLPLAAAAAILLAGTPAAAHHGWSSYDSSKLTTLTAPVVESNFSHPHGTLVIEADGKRWEVILAPPSRMTNRVLAP